MKLNYDNDRRHTVFGVSRLRVNNNEIKEGDIVIPKDAWPYLRQVICDVAYRDKKKEDKIKQALSQAKEI